MRKTSIDSVIRNARKHYRYKPVPSKRTFQEVTRCFGLLIAEEWDNDSMSRTLLCLMTYGGSLRGQLYRKKKKS